MDADENKRCMDAFLYNDNSSPYYQAKIYLMKMSTDYSFGSKFGEHYGYDNEITYNHIKTLLSVPHGRNFVIQMIKKTVEDVNSPPRNLTPYEFVCPEIVGAFITWEYFFEGDRESFEKFLNQKRKYEIYRKCTRQHYLEQEELKRIHGAEW